MARENDRLRTRLGVALRDVSRLPSVDEPGLSMLITPPDAWRRLRDMQNVVAEQPAIAHAVRCLSLLDVLELQLDLLRQPEWPEFENPEPLPPNVIRFVHAVAELSSKPVYASAVSGSRATDAIDPASILRVRSGRHRINSAGCRNHGPASPVAMCSSRSMSTRLSLTVA